jgi:hypothetical protein
MNTDRLEARTRPTLTFEIERDELPSRQRAAHPPLSWLLGRKAMAARVARATRVQFFDEPSFDDA